MFRKIAITLAATALVAVPVAAETVPTKVDPHFVSQLRDALLQNPEIIFEAATIGQQKQRDAQASQQNAAVAEFRPQILAQTAFGPVLGNITAKTTVAEFLDYRCGYCQRSAAIVDKVVDANKEVRVVVVMRPILGPDSETLARFALASAKQGKFRQTHDALYALPHAQVTDEVLRGVAEKVGLNFDKAKSDMISDAVVNELKQHTELANKMNINGTPYFVMPNAVVPGAPASEEKFLEAIRG